MATLKLKDAILLLPLILPSCSGGTDGTAAWMLNVAANGPYVSYADGEKVIFYNAQDGSRKEVKTSGKAYGVTVTPGGDAVFFFENAGSFDPGDGTSRTRAVLNAWYPADAAAPVKVADYVEDYDLTGDFKHLLTRFRPDGGTVQGGCNTLALWDVKARQATEVDRCVEKAGIENIAVVSPDSGKFVYIKSGSNFLYDMVRKTKTSLGKSYAVFSADSMMLAYCIINPGDPAAGELRLLKLADYSDVPVDARVPLTTASTVAEMQKFSGDSAFLFHSRDKGGAGTDFIRYDIAAGTSSVVVGGGGAGGVDFQAAGQGEILVYRLGSTLIAYDYKTRVSRVLHDGWDGGFEISPDGRNVVLLRQYTHDTQAWLDETVGDIETVSTSDGTWRFVSDNAVFGFYRPQRKYQFNAAGDGLFFMAAERYDGRESHYLGLWDFDAGAARDIRVVDVFDYRQDAASGAIAYSMREAGRTAESDSAAVYYFDPSSGKKSVRVGTICKDGCTGLNTHFEGLFRIDGGYVSYVSEDGVFMYEIKTGKNVKL